VKDGEYLRAARQLQMKQGPIYDRWKVAMEARGEQKRCKECRAFGPKGAPRGTTYCGFAGWLVNPGQFACRWFRPKEDEG